jgi:UDP-3-O-[3-hydroxymyristoyl] glucosamine N-acyltransferase
MAAQVGVAGSSRIGDHCMIGGQVGIAGHLQVAPRTNIGAQAGLNASVEKPDTTIIGSPVMDFKAFMKSFVVYRKLPQLEKRLEALEKKSKE